MTQSNIAGFKLSLQQERIWLQQSGQQPFTSLLVCRIDGSLDINRLRKSFDAVIHRHEILRTTFHEQIGIKVPFQVIQDKPDATGVAFDEIAIEPASLTASLKQASVCFDLIHGPVIQARLLRASANQHLLAIQTPALIADATGLAILAAELAQHYANQTDPSLSADVLQYADFVEWQNELLNGDDARAGREFWRNHCRSIFPLVETTLPFEQQRQSGRFQPAVFETVVESGICSRIESACQQADVGIADVMAGVYALLLSRLATQSSITLGYELEGRKYEELATAVGSFAKSLPVAVPMAADESFISLVRRLKGASADIQNWEEAFSWNLLEASHGHADGQTLPLQYSYRELPAGAVIGGVSFQVIRQESLSERFKLKLAAVRSGEQLELRFHYDAACLSGAAVAQWAGYFRTLLAAAAAEPDSHISRLPLLNAADRQQMLVKWNQTATEYPKQCLHALFEAQVLRTPDRLALRVGAQALSFAQLNARSNQLAHHLRSLGVGPDVLVGLAVERSLEMMVALLAILKAGGAYVPLNPDNPRPRLAQQLAGTAVLLTQQSLLAQMPDFTGPTLCLDRDASSWKHEPAGNPSLNTTPEQLIYILYTSGSTGAPKGVAVRHRNLVNYAHSICQQLEVARFATGLHFATVSTIGADLGNTCIFPALISGGCLHVISYEDATDTQRFARYLKQYPVDVLKIVPSHLQALLTANDPRALLPHRYLIIGGEALAPALLDAITVLAPGCELINHYGPTETTVGSLTLKLKGYDRSHRLSDSIPIGRPIANTQVYVLDEQLQPVPPGVIGELYIAGAGVAAGYLNQPEKTAERFLGNPFSSDTEERMYRTGDQVRYQPDGNIEFIGRGDDQVKIRGFRIELGEIESILSRHPAVKQALVLARLDERGEKRLIAYLVLNREPATTTEALRDHLKQQLPDYMVPQALIPLPRFPLTANGKIDRLALPAPEDALAQRGVYVAPTNPTQEVVASIWAEVLKRERVSVHDNFFDLGGHSLMATQVISRIRRSLNIDLPLRALFDAPTIAGVSNQVEQLRRGQAGTVMPPIARAPRDSDLPLSFAQQRLWVLDQLEPNNPLYNVPRTLRIKGSLNVSAMTDSINEIIRRHESQRTTFETRNGKPVQIIAASLEIPLPVRDLTSLPESTREAEARRIASEEALTPFDLAHGPLVRAQLLRLAPADHVLLLTMHHIISDAWSAAIFFQELNKLYEAFAANSPSPLPELEIQYADYALWQREWLRGQVLDQQLAYWREQLQGAPPLLSLPTDRPRNKQQSFNGALQSIPFSPELAKTLKDFSRNEGITLFMTLLAGFQSLLMRYSGQEQIVIGTDAANRPTLDTESLIGFFINLLAIRSDLTGNPTFRELLGRVRDTTLDAYAHQDMPFDKLVEELQPERSLSHSPIVQVLFVMQNIPRSRTTLAGLELSAFEMPVNRSKFDLAVFMMETSSGLTGHWVYSTDLFDLATIRRMAAHYETLMQSAAGNPETRLANLALYSESEKKQIGAATKQRKQSQLGNLLKAEPRAVKLPAANQPGEES